MYAVIPERYREEQVFIREIWFEPTEPSVRLIYADWLDDHQDIRAEILRNDVQMLELEDKEDMVSIRQRRRLSEERRRIIKPDHWAWVALVGCCEIDCLSQVQAARERDPFRFRCPNAGKSYNR